VQLDIPAELDVLQRRNPGAITGVSSLQRGTKHCSCFSEPTPIVLNYLILLIRLGIFVLNEQFIEWNRPIY